MVLRVCYAVCGTARACGVGWCAVCGTGIAHGRGTELVYGARRIASTRTEIAYGARRASNHAQPVRHLLAETGALKRGKCVA
eukprot:102940-Rhodomonas_salina.1